MIGVWILFHLASGKPLLEIFLSSGLLTQKFRELILGGLDERGIAGLAFSVLDHGTVVQRQPPSKQSFGKFVEMIIGGETSTIPGLVERSHGFLEMLAVLSCRGPQQILLLQAQ